MLLNARSHFERFVRWSSFYSGPSLGRSRAGFVQHRTDTPLDYSEAERNPEVARQREEALRLLDMMATGEKQNAVPLIIGAEHLLNRAEQIELRSPLSPQQRYGVGQVAGKQEIDKAMNVALRAGVNWRDVPLEHRARCLFRAADLAVTRSRLMLATASSLTYGQPLSVGDSLGGIALAAGLRSAAYSALSLQAGSVRGVDELRAQAAVSHDALEGFTYVHSSAYGPETTAAMLASALVMGNSVVWRPSTQALFTAYHVHMLLTEAGLPPGVLNLLSGRSRDVSSRVLAHPSVGALVCSGRVTTLSSLFALAAQNPRARVFPRFVAQGPTNAFLLAHASADAVDVANAISQGAFTAAGQHPSAFRRAYIPSMLWRQVLPIVRDQLSSVVVHGPPDQLNAQLGTVLNRHVFNEAVAAIDAARASQTLIVGGDYQRDEADSHGGFFIQPTVILAQKHLDRSLDTRTPLPAPILFVHVYDEVNLDTLVNHLTVSSELVGPCSLICADRDVIADVSRRLSRACTRVVVNDATVASAIDEVQFSHMGGARLSGTGHQAGSQRMLLDLSLQRVYAENFEPVLTINPAEFADDFDDGFSASDDEIGGDSDNDDDDDEQKEKSGEHGGSDADDEQTATDGDLPAGDPASWIDPNEVDSPELKKYGITYDELVSGMREMQQAGIDPRKNYTETELNEKINASQPGPGARLPNIAKMASKMQDTAAPPSAARIPPSAPIRKPPTPKRR